MATEAQITANRRNSQKSTGPKTAEGKDAVSQNALKHGLFAHEAVIQGEIQADFELHREALLAEWRPVGPTESMLAERIVSLSWRVLRAERMQNQATDCMILRQVADGKDSKLKQSYCQAKAISPDDPRASQEPLILGRITTKLWSNNSRLIERLFMHERRIESSLFRTMRELKRLQIMRRIEHDATSDKSVARTRPAQAHKSDCAKQSQFAPALMGIRPLLRKDYDDTPSVGPGENKADQSQTLAFGRVCPPVEGEMAAALRASQ